jgi:RNA recognition motif-containing protein
VAARIYVGNLPYSATDQQLTDLFAAYGEVVEVHIIVDRDSGQSKGFGFVQMQDDAAASQAIAGLNGTNLDGRALKVSEAQARPDRSNGRSNDRPRRW